MNFFQKTALLLPALLIAGTTIIKAQTDVNYDPKAKTILDDVSKTAKAYTSISASFTITTKHADGTSDVRNGSAIISGSKYKMILENKVKDVVYKDEYYNDGTTTWVFTGKAGELTIDNASAASTTSDAITPNNIFTFYEKGFKYTFVEEKTVGGKVLDYINLYPEKPEKKNYHTVKLAIDKAKKQIVSVTLLNKDGSTVTYDVTTLTPNVTVTTATFQFDEKSHTVKSRVDMREESGD